jgi:hypothetical protein
MRPVRLLLVLFALTAGAAALPAQPAGAVCSVFARHPCAPTVCSVFQRRPCVPEIEYPIGQDLRLTIESTRRDPADAVTAQDGSGEGSEHKLNTISDTFAALRGCWVPPSADAARPGMQMSVRLSFKRNGEIIGTPRVTYVSPGAPNEAKDIYRQAITQALERCTPMPFTAGLGGALAGRPIAIRFVDNRSNP